MPWESFSKAIAEDNWRQPAVYVRLARGTDTPAIVALSQRVQAGLTASGSRQRIGPLSPGLVSECVASGAAYVLDDPPQLLGSVFVEPVTADGLPARNLWGLGACPDPLVYLHTLMIEPEQQGHGLGRILLDGVKAAVQVREPGSVIVLDCWAGNAKLRSFYTAAGFRLRGIFPEQDYEIAVFTWPS